MYKFWIKTVLLYPKMYIWSRKTKKFVLFTLKMKFWPKNFTKKYKFWIKTVFCTHKCTFGPENQKICTFYSKNEVFAKQFHWNVQILIKIVVLYPKMYIWSWKTKKVVLFTLKMAFLPNNFTKMYTFWIKSVVLYPKIYIWSQKKQKIVLFTLKMKFLPK